MFLKCQEYITILRQRIWEHINTADNGKSGYRGGDSNSLSYGFVDMLLNVLLP
jgi:hypothetical protein